MGSAGGIILVLAVLVYIAIRFFSRLKDGQNKGKYDFARALVLIVLYFLISLSLRVCEGKGADSFTIQKTIVPFGVHNIYNIDRRENQEQSIMEFAFKPD